MSNKRSFTSSYLAQKLLHGLLVFLNVAFFFCRVSHTFRQGLITTALASHLGGGTLTLKRLSIGIKVVGYQAGPASLNWIQQMTQKEGKDPFASTSGCSPGLDALPCSAPGSPPAPHAPGTQSGFEHPAALISAESGPSGRCGTWETHQQNKDAHVSGRAPPPPFFKKKKPPLI